MSFFRIVWKLICVLITFLARNVYLIIIIFVQWMLKTFSSLVGWTFSIIAMAVATEAAASALTTQQACWNRKGVPSPYVQSRSHSQLTLGVSAQHGGDLDVYQPLTVVPENEYGRPPEQSWSTQIFLSLFILSGICCCHVNVEEPSLRLRNLLLCTVQWDVIKLILIRIM